MREQPSAAELLEAVTEFLRQDATPALAGRHAFHKRVAANVLDIVRRELIDGPRAERQEVERLASLLGMSGDADTLNAELCDRLVAGTIDPDDPALIAHLWATTLDTVAIDQPNYATYRREKSGWR